MQIKNHIIIHGYLGLNNVGDEASAEVVLNRERVKNPTATFYLASHINPISSGKIFSLKTVRAQLYDLHFIKTLIRTKKVIFAGGGRYGIQTIKYMSLLSIVARLFGAKVIWDSIGAYDYEWDGKRETIFSKPKFNISFFSKLIIRLGLIVSDVSVRDYYSKQFLNHILPNKKIVVKKDLVNYLNLEKPKAKYRKTTIGISIRSCEFTLNNQKFLKDVYAFIYKLISNHINVVFIPFGYSKESENSFDDDTRILKRMPNMIDDKKRIKIIKLFLNLFFFEVQRTSQAL